MLEDEQISAIRKAEADYHHAYYTAHHVYEKGTWLERPDSLVTAWIQSQPQESAFEVLDLACGVGRNLFPVLKQFPKARGTGVDLLNSAVETAQQYAKDTGLSPRCRWEVKDQDAFTITPKSWDLIMAFASLEHTASPRHLHKLLHRMAEGTSFGGTNVLAMNTEATETIQKTGETYRALFETNIDAADALSLINVAYQNWHRLKLTIEPVTFPIRRDGCAITVNAKQIRALVKRPLLH
ncbi:methyltransferase family protein [Salsuginibacillus halophilus]|uniref:Methyltransferase family protein n=1 Tax=Salsuginibacillus halophilus TaxID=517424 RepID=A0A2P8HW60_9BACI|nr:class I SAM-dependent methyltransferase [Salsuginibacillus halophilus]PSL50418.1 methyltransferase family protein [Salsuginibacillus halophilus]